MLFFGLLDSITIIDFELSLSTNVTMNSERTFTYSQIFFWSGVENENQIFSLSIFEIWKKDSAWQRLIKWLHLNSRRFINTVVTFFLKMWGKTVWIRKGLNRSWKNLSHFYISKKFWKPCQTFGRLVVAVWSRTDWLVLSKVSKTFLKYEMAQFFYELLS